MSGVFNNAFPSGLTVPAASNVRFGVAVGATTGTAYIPAASDVRFGVNVDATTGTVRVPTAANVRSGTAVDVSGTGSLAVPTASQVLLGVNVDATVGNVRLPAVNQVLLGFDYGPSDTLEGTLDPGAGGTVPAASDVRFGVAVGFGTGTCRVPTAAQVLLGTAVDVAATGTVRLPAVADVQSGVVFGASDALTGVFVSPAVTNVLSGVTYGAASEFTGTYVTVSQPNVRAGITYGPSSSLTGLINVPTAAQVLLGVSIDQTTGTVRLPIVGDVRDGVLYGPSDSLSGTLVGSVANYPAEDEVLEGVTFGDAMELNGTVRLPIVDHVLAGIMYGPGLTHLEGTLTIPATGNVRTMVAYGIGNSQIGQLNLPAVSDVRLGVSYDNATKTGTVRVPVASDVRLGTAYGASDSVTGTAAIPAASNVRFGVAVGASTGTVRVPAAADVRLGVSTDVALTGTVRLPIESDVRSGVAYDAADSKLGTLDVTGDPPLFPAQSDVRLGVTYGTDSNPTQFTGNVRVPAVGKVEAGYAYDAADSLTGTLDPGLGNPEVIDVRFGVAFGDGLVGVLELPAEPQVLVGIGYGAYGTEFEGTLIDTPGGAGMILPPVTTQGGLRSPLVVGDDYVAAKGMAFIWTAELWENPGEAIFSGSPGCSCDESPTWQVAGTISTTDGVSTLTFELPENVSSAIAAGEYQWAVKVDGVTVAGSHLSGEVIWVCLF